MGSGGTSPYPARGTWHLQVFDLDDRRSSAASSISPYRAATAATPKTRWVDSTRVTTPDASGHSPSTELRSSAKELDSVSRDWAASFTGAATAIIGEDETAPRDCPAEWPAGGIGVVVALPHRANDEESPLELSKKPLLVFVSRELDHPPSVGGQEPFDLFSRVCGSVLPTTSRHSADVRSASRCTTSATAATTAGSDT